MAGIFALVMLFTISAAATEYVVEKSKSTVNWNGKKVTGEHYGTVDLKSGKIEFNDNEIISGIIELQMNTIVNQDIENESSNAKLVAHLKSDDFFSVENHPVSIFVLKNAKHKSGNDYSFTGDLTIKGITHPVTFDAEIDVTDSQLKAKGEIEVDRTLYDIKFRSGKYFPDVGDRLIYDTFTLNFDLVASPTSGNATSQLK